MNPRKRPKKSQPTETKNTQPQENIDQSFPIVGIGSSAGGLEPCIQILSQLPDDTGMGFVIIQHLAADQKSMLTEILSRATSMPVQQVEDNTIVQPNHVYVIPPNAKMTIAQGTLKLTPREAVRGVFMSVDAFLISLAQDRKNKAIGIILSGGDSDGARGVQEIKGAGGITFAQCQDTAKVDSMPHTAVATGQVDFILSPEDIAQELVNISQHPYIVNSNPIQVIETTQEQSEDETYLKIFELLKTAKNVDFGYYKQTTIKRRIMRRLALHKIDKLSNYIPYLENDPDEVVALYHDLLINVTNFFRDPESFDALKSQVFPVITKDKSSSSPIRVWVAGCSTGEEAYSIAISLQEFLADQPIKPPVQIYATDLSEVVIEKARVGIYCPSQIVDVSPQRLQRFFVQVEGGYQICKSVREQCVFAKQNLISDPPFSRLDLITCRNVLIYLGTTSQKKLLPVFHYGLKSTGYLMLGTSETIGDFLNLFSLVDKKNKIYSRKVATAQLNVDLVASNYSTEIINPKIIIREEDGGDLDLQREADRIVLDQFAPVGVIVNSELDILQFRGKTSPYLEPSPGKASLNLLKMAKPELRLELRTAIHQAKKQDTAVTKENILLNDSSRQVRIDIIPFKTATAAEVNFLVLFRDTQFFSTTGTTPQLSPTQTSDEEVARLRQELATTKEYLQSIIEEQQATNQDLRAANEEILSSNEELQSTNEELETAKEEIQAANEELNTINEELFRRNIELTIVSNDLQNLLSSINIPILMLEGDLRIRRFTPMAQRILNLIPSDVGRPFGDIKHSLNVPNLEEQVLEVINTLTIKEQEVQDHAGHWYDLRIRPYRTIDNKIDGAVLILVDIDALKCSAAQLVASRNYAETIVETMQEPLVVMDKDLRVTTANRAFYEMFQVTPSQTEQQLIFELGNGQWNIPALRSLLEEILPNTTNSQNIQDFEVEHDFEKIGHKTMLLNARKMAQDSEDEMILLTIQDITEAKRLQAELTQLLTQEQSARTTAEAANRAKDEFLSMLSHELRNPLNSLLGWAQLLRRPNIEPTRIKQGLEAIERSAKTQSRLIEDLLDISRITSGKLRLNASAIEIAPIIGSALEVVRVSADAKQIEIESNLDPTPKQVLADLERIQQILGNLLSNAIKFTPPGGRVSVTLAYSNSHAQIQVSDTGIGISAEFLPHVFERFRQADGSQTRSNTGLGLGLTIVRHLIELHGGTIEAESAGQGQGSVFTMRLPLQNAIAQTAASPVEPITEPVMPVGDIPSLAGVRVLMVEDEADNRDIFSMILEQHGVTVTEAASASEALAILTANPEEFDVLVSDIHMPEQDGYRLIRQIRALSAQEGGEIRAIALTAYARSEDQQQAITAGFQMHLTKPIDPEQLAVAVASLTGRINNA